MKRPRTVCSNGRARKGGMHGIGSRFDPYPVSAQSAAKFYRYRGHTPVTIVANPYLM
jgi:hypothetical protein